MRRTVAAAAFLLLAGAAPRPATAQLTLSGAGFVSSVEHRVTAGGGLEATVGTVFGAAATVTLGTVALDAAAAGGNLSATTATADNQAFATAWLRAALRPMPWLALTAGLSIAAFDTPLARQRWTTTRVGAEARLPFLTGAFTAMVRGELFPTTSVTGLDKPDLAFSAGTGLQWHGGPFTASLVYALERYDFPPTGGIRRREQLSTLTACLGLRLLTRDPAAGQ